MVAAAGTGGGTPLHAALPTLYKVLSNIAEHQDETKYRRVRASKLPPALLANPETLALLAVLGFRPVVYPLDAAARGGEDAFLALAGGREAEAAVAQAAQALKPHVP